MFDFWGRARSPQPGSQLSNSRYQRTCRNQHSHRSSPAPPEPGLFLDFSKVQHPKFHCLKFTIQPVELGFHGIQQDHSRGFFLACAMLHFSMWELGITIPARLCALQPLNCFSWPRIIWRHTQWNKYWVSLAKNPFVSFVAAQEIMSVLEKRNSWLKSSHPAQIHPFGWQAMGPPATEPGEQPGMLPTLPLLPPVPADCSKVPGAFQELFDRAAELS